MHDEHMRNLFKTIKTTKKLYESKLQPYTQQLKWANKGSDIAGSSQSDLTSQKFKSVGPTSPLPNIPHGLKRTQTQQL